MGTTYPYQSVFWSLNGQDKVPQNTVRRVKRGASYLSQSVEDRGEQLHQSRITAVEMHPLGDTQTVTDIGCEVGEKAG